MSSPTPTPSPTPKEVNFKTLATDFETLANLHKQLNSFGLGDIDQLTYWTQSRLKEENTEYQSPYYPLLYIVPSKVENDLQYKVWEFNTTVSDIVEDSLQNNEDTLSDTLQILQDVISQFRLSTTNVLGNYYDKYYVDDEVVCTPFLGEQDDDLNGWNGLLRIKTMTSLDRCAAAFNEWTGASITHPNGINLKTFTDDFRILSDYHKQIQSYGFGKMDEFTYWNEMRLKEDNTQFNSPYYPYFYVIPNDVIQKFGFMEYKFTFIVSDIIQRSLENQVDVLSDTLQIMDDILGQFRLSVTNSLGNFNELYYLNTPIVCTPFLEKYDDLLGGWVADITIEVKTPLDRCDAPFLPFVSPTPTATPTSTAGIPSPTPTSTPTMTPTNTETPTTTPTPSITATNTQTPTTTATNTSTPTPTPTQPFDSDAAAYLAAVLSAGGTGITATVSGATNTLFTSLKSAGLYNDISAMWLQLGGVAASCRLESKLQSAYNLTFFGGMSHSYSGSTGNNSNAYADPSFTQSLINPNSVYFSVYINNNFTVATLDTFEFGCGPGYRGLISAKYNNGNTYAHSLGNASQFAQVANAVTPGFYMVNASGSTSYQAYKNGSQISNITRTFTTPVSTHKYLLWNWAQNGTNPWSSGYSPARMASILFGTNMNGTKQTTLHTLIHNFETTLGRNY
jgi:hypothetical protein